MTDEEKLQLDIAEAIPKLIAEFPIKIDWNPNDFGRDGAHFRDELLQKGLDDYSEELYELNIDYFYEIQHQLVIYIIDEFEEELREFYQLGWPDEPEEGFDDTITDYIEKTFLFPWDLNMDQFCSYLPPVTVTLPMYSNYDCTNSFNDIDNDGHDSYLWQVFQPVKNAISKGALMFEHTEGAYGGALLCFVFKCDVKEFLELQNKWELNDSVTIPKGTQFGFLSRFQGAASIFEKRTQSEITIPIQYGDTQYDHIGFERDGNSGYGLHDIFGHTDFIDEGSVSVK